MNSFSFDGTHLIDDSGETDNVRAFSVSEISGALKRTVENAFSHIRVRGEISGFTRAGSGHCYLALKDDKSVLDSVIWRGVASHIGFLPENGMEVIATGRLTTYAGRSRYQLVIERLEIAGQGALMALLDRRRRALAEEGLFDQQRKKALPFLPQVIGVVSSPSGAVIRDILHRLADRCPSHVILWPVPVQGEQSAEKIAAAIRSFSALEAKSIIPRPDLLIVARGGGSLEDLWGFNEEVVVRAVAECSIPIISAVGHETDTTLCDFAADLRAPTPTAAAELAVPVKSELISQLKALHLRMNNAVNRYYHLSNERLQGISRRLPASERLLAPFMQRFDDETEHFKRSMTDRLAVAYHKMAACAATLRPALLVSRIAREQARLSACRLPSRQHLIMQEQRKVVIAHQRLVSAYQHKLARTAMQLDFIRNKLKPVLLKRSWQQKYDRLASCIIKPDRISARLDTMEKTVNQLWRIAEQAHPDKILAKGYARVENKEGQTICNAEQARQQSLLTLIFHDGTLPVIPSVIRPQPSPNKLSKRSPSDDQPNLL
ncbi:exodeoxyribonuclease VII large subunit [Zymomonas mobilis]|uniref:exodeoxyribonuclease VII large subunit n=1 Tax=Zymomonas mobilis TaxID=542 RepID=UPI0003076C64|nr:exodeoxyribonuclease VII large subunit [Zymomonas mobilis]MDX5949153.1 exodeoxyribonuclease VII large subunit [Zymomonas mobilis subsp. pomaceae]GEB89789.1 exodeoxyribonuclease 7 large subunit [Zymomonas mobilis subsp. pomaceae]